MAQLERKKLDSGDMFPRLELRLTDGSSLVLPDTTAGQWTVLLVYRGIF
jgi:peroxiredoxin